MIKRLVNSSIVFRIFTLIKPKNTNMSRFERVFVRNVVEDDCIHISFKYFVVPADNSKVRFFNFKRPKDEELEKSLLRISGNITKEVNRKIGKKKKAKPLIVTDLHEVCENAVVPVELLDAKEQPINPLEKNCHAWSGGHRLSIGNIIYEVELNAPTVLNLSLPYIILSNFTILPKMTLEFVNINECQFSWKVYKPADTDKRKLSMSENWFEVSKGFHFVPLKEHIGSYVKVSCVPVNGDRIGEEMSSISKGPISEGPVCPFENRHKFTQEITSGNVFRVVSYNILADLYADSDFSRDVLYPYCPPHYLHIDYRKLLIIKELLGYNADIICLQEVDKKVFTHDLIPSLGHAGFCGLLRSKMGEVAEGCATFYRKSRFTFVESYDTGVTDILMKKDRVMSDLLDQISSKNSLLDKIMERKTILQVTLLKEEVEEVEKFVLVATTHLFFHPEAANIRLIQAHLCIYYLQDLLKKLRGLKSIEPSVIFCGDLNASITSAVHEYLLGRSVSSTHCDFLSGGIEEHVPNLFLTHNLHLSNACGFPLYTNYVKGFNACLDYIYTSSLSCKSVIPMPSHQEVEANLALPNRCFPSDHIAIGCDLEWTSEVGVMFVYYTSRFWWCWRRKMSGRNKQPKQSSKSYSGIQKNTCNNDDEGCPKINLDLKLESEMLGFIQSSVAQQRRNEENRASHRMTKKRISDVYDILLKTGFNRESIESSMFHCLPVGGDLVSLLDWLCLNTKDEDLPENFSQVLKEEEQKMRPKFVAEVKNVSNQPPTKTKRTNGCSNSNMKDWILKYAEARDSDDGDDTCGDGDDACDDGDDACSDNNGALMKSGIHKTAQGKESHLDEELNEKFISAVANYLDLKASSGDKNEMESLLNELKSMKLKPGFDLRNKRLLNLKSELSSLRSGEDENEEGLDIGGLFFQEGGPPATHNEAPKKSTPSKELETRDFSYTRQQWTGKSPKQFLIDWTRKKMQSCSLSYEKIDAGGGKWRSKCILKRPAKEGGDLTVLPEILCTNVKDAEHLSCTLLLYTLCKDKDLHLLLPPPYRDMWIEWKKEEKEKVAVMSKEGTKDRDAFVEKLYNKINTSKSCSTKVTTKFDDNCVDSWESRDDNYDKTNKHPCLTLTSDLKQRCLTECKQIFETNKKSPQFQDLFSERELLPVHNLRQKIIETFRNHEVFIIAGETGSGKSTQVPQFILEELLSSSPSSSPPLIICTEPRRISAVSLSHRVSSEMGEKGGPGMQRSLCGYQIRSEVKKTVHTRLLFCTTGVLLRRMQENMGLGDISCVIVDEVHERDLNTDVLLIHLLELLAKKPTVQGSKLKVILMSATLDCDKFSRYFFDCPILLVQGRSHHVEVLHMENIIELTKYQLESDSPYALRYEDIIQEETARIKVTGKSGEIKNVEVSWSKKDLFSIDKSGLDPKQFSLNTRNTMTRMNEELINVDLILEIIRWLSLGGVGKGGDDGEKLRGREGSVLVFLPGLSAIDEIREVMTSDSFFGDSSKFLVLPLHSVLSSKEQSFVFSTPPAGVRKVILSTNIAETGLTIPDVVYVIDCGREKQKRYLDSSRISQLRQVWISQASAKQRQGRAGRVRSGVCFRLFTRERFETMSLQGLPEMKRLPLQGLCLHVLKCYSRPPSEILSKSIDPPKPSSVSTAMSILREVGACVGNNLTPLGNHLARLPLDAKMGKILIYAGVLGCLDQASLLVSCMTEKSPFQSRLERDADALSEVGKNQFDLFGSDQLATFLAVKRCLSLKTRGERMSYCRKCRLKYDVVKDIETSARELKNLVTECGLHSYVPDALDPNLLKTFSSSSVDPKPPMVALLKAVLVAGLYPNVGRLVVDDKSGGRQKSVEVHLGPSGEVATIHGSSVNRKVNSNGWIIYQDKEKPNQVSLIDTTLVPEMPLLLFGGDIQVQHQHHTLMVDNWIKFKAPAKVGVLMKEMKMRLDEFLDRKLHNPMLDISKEPLLSLLIRLLVSHS